MLNSNPWWAMVAAAGLAVFVAGCPGPSNDQPVQPVTPGATTLEPPTTGGTSGTEAASGTEKPPAPTMPKVVMGELDRQKCRVWVGDAFPAAELPDLQGVPRSTAALRGERLTVFLFWTSGNTNHERVSALNALEDLQHDVFEPYSGRGVTVVAVNVRDTAEAAGKLTADAKVAYPVLFDTDGSLFAKLATEKLPRVYLLDAKGKVLWLDIEYSQTTRENLSQAVRSVLEE